MNAQLIALFFSIFPVTSEFCITDRGFVNTNYVEVPDIDLKATAFVRLQGHGLDGEKTLKEKAWEYINNYFFTHGKEIWTDARIPAKHDGYVDPNALVHCPHGRDWRKAPVSNLRSKYRHSWSLGGRDTKRALYWRTTQPIDNPHLHSSNSFDEDEANKRLDDAEKTLGKRLNGDFYYDAPIFKGIYVHHEDIIERVYVPKARKHYKGGHTSKGDHGDSDYYSPKPYARIQHKHAQQAELVLAQQEAEEESEAEFNKRWDAINADYDVDLEWAEQQAKENDWHNFLPEAYVEVRPFEAALVKAMGVTAKMDPDTYLADYVEAQQLYEDTRRDAELIENKKKEDHKRWHDEYQAERDEYRRICQLKGLEKLQALPQDTESHHAADCALLDIIDQYAPTEIAQQARHLFVSMPKYYE